MHSLHNCIDEYRDKRYPTNGMFKLTPTEYLPVSVRILNKVALSRGRFNGRGPIRSCFPKKPFGKSVPTYRRRPRSVHVVIALRSRNIY